ncbi:MAG: hypothetical protein ACR2LV_07045 [Solirubrobacteraceae bacterium]
MEGAWLVRMRWRRRGAWLWPVFAVATVADALVGHALPSSGEAQTVFGSGLSACFLNLIAVVLLSRPLAALVRRLRGDLPTVVARDYAGTFAVAGVATALLMAGLLHRPSVLAHRQSMQDAIARAQAWIGDRAPAEFRQNVQVLSTFTIEAGRMYRTCVPNHARTRTYCVIVKTGLPLARSVSFAGYEPNSVLFARGLG